MKNKTIIAVSILTLVLISGIFGFLLGISFKGESNQNDSKDQNGNRYQMINVNENNIIIFDQQTGDYWRRFIPSNEGPTEWEKEKSPINK
ncbi:MULTISPECIES: hypothetical protein [Paenibacillus]|uniref:Uncharacterized protein n=1 Tax=Paenibacillus sabinae T27 TaxID=1268072 RepID=X4ZH68_9BACL|nr:MULTISPECIES: hypothetical protein [Paenibacillus]AHV98831.1 hypothetical protein PSAB_19690 [Paenibacillus sabinae T27]BCG60800.1 hypothetical protein PUR_42250 [Paenibacillus sp. URB8-2]